MDGWFGRKGRIVMKEAFMLVFALCLVVLGGLMRCRLRDRSCVDMSARLQLTQHQTLSFVDSWMEYPKR